MIFQDVKTVTTAPVNLLADMPDTDRPLEVHVFANGAYVGNESVTPADGFPLALNERHVFHLHGGTPLYAVVDAFTTEARVLALGL